MTDALVEAGLTYEGAREYWTPRRLALDIRGLTARSADQREEIKGPSTKAPEQAVQGFLRKTNHVNWQMSFTPIAAPAYRVSPNLVFWLALALGGCFALAAAWFLRRWYLVIRPRQEPVRIDPGSLPLNMSRQAVHPSSSRRSTTAQYTG